MMAAVQAPRPDGLAKVTGAATYAADITRPGMLWGKVLRSPLPHARIVSMDVSRARALPGVVAVLTSEDIPPYRIGRAMRDMPVLAMGKVRFAGEKVAAVAAESASIALAAVDLIRVDYEELPAVFDPVEATRPGAPAIHDPETVRAWKTPKQRPGDIPNSVTEVITGSTRDEMDVAFAGAAHVFEHTFTVLPQHQGYLEPHACLVEIDQHGVTHVWASNKAPFLMLDYLREGLGLGRDRVEAHLLPLGGDFGGKASLMDIPVAYVLARATGRPVKMVMSYVEELQGGNPRHAAAMILTSGFDTDGRLVAHLTRAYYASGGYAANKPNVDAGLPGMASGGCRAYTIPVWRVESHMVYTNATPGGHMRAPGDAQPTHAMECHVDLCARKMGRDPLEVRLRNAPTEPRRLPGGEQGSLPRAREVLETAANAIGWHAPKTAGIGRGIVLERIGCNGGDYEAEMALQRDGTLVLYTPIIENGAGMLAVFRQMTAERMGVPVGSVRVVQTTRNITFDRGVGGSRVTRIAGLMIDQLTQQIQGRVVELAAAEFGQDASAVAWEAGGLRFADGRFLPLGEAAGLAQEDLLEHHVHRSDAATDSVQVWAAQATEVDVDPETGKVTLRRIVSVHEVGRVVDPLLFQGQIQGGLMQGLGYALTEGVQTEDGRVITTNLHEYKLPCMADMPEMETILLPVDPSLGITPIGEGPNSGMAPCVVNAVVDAIGAPVRLDIPLSAEAIREAIASSHR